MFHPTKTACFLTKRKQLLVTTKLAGLRSDVLSLSKGIFIIPNPIVLLFFPSSTQKRNGPPLIRSFHKECESKLNMNLNFRLSKLSFSISALFELLGFKKQKNNAEA